MGVWTRRTCTDGRPTIARPAHAPARARERRARRVALLATTAARFATTGIYQLTESRAWEDIAGVLGLFLCGLAIYAALAMALEDARRSTLLPLGRIGAGRESVEGSLDEQLERIERQLAFESSCSGKGRTVGRRYLVAHHVAPGMDAERLARSAPH